ncbi:Ditrans,polycis-undecaprenyl-diphosphate synthase ((2E,6E)-farnesyl-diphosphate specific) [Andreprevotia sp. IGB-42]|uniref:polyprenyl diphosphate synthase n=1 Tax=Andreprevotia sp. IGB-42 TaxID=2497473 RepID=UPI001358EE0C|nr:polyprenyl diphosphate synthase [Andreprevotia sp. IGB-42]KAF0814378.1 Ditrans,polycis-undecaprenyl-diphosphate synthase ((2E,6E)-farnesyl-diphosphate specific) [Andreprevotia sp. IGB-42]
MFKSSTEAVPDQVKDVPRHVAVIMDGNGRWAKQRFMPRIFGHKRGVDALRETIKACDALGVEFLTVFAFSSENWRRPPDEVTFLMGLFIKVLGSEIERMHANQIRLRIVGNRSRFTPDLLALIEAAEASTAGNTGLTLSVAVDYGGRWDVIQATQAMLADHPDLAQSFDEADLAPYLAMSYAPEPDLFIRTGGEQRISNFLLWQLAYTELYFTDLLWPDFGRPALEAAIDWYAGRERRFGRISEQVKPAS